MVVINELIVKTRWSYKGEFYCTLLEEYHMQTGIETGLTQENHENTAKKHTVQS